MAKDSGRPIEISISKEELEKLKLHDGATTRIKGVIKDGKLTVTGIQHDFSSPFMHEWPPAPGDD